MTFLFKLQDENALYHKNEAGDLQVREVFGLEEIYPHNNDMNTNRKLFDLYTKVI